MLKVGGKCMSQTEQMHRPATLSPSLNLCTHVLKRLTSAGPSPSASLMKYAMASRFMSMMPSTKYTRVLLQQGVSRESSVTSEQTCTRSALQPFSRTQSRLHWVPAEHKPMQGC